MAKRGSSCLFALIALACAWPLGGCGGSDDNGSEQAKTIASSENRSSGGGVQAGGEQSSSGEGSGSQGTDGQAQAARSQPPTGASSATPPTQAAPGETSRDEGSSGQSHRHPKKPHKSHSGGKSGGNSTTGLSPQESAAFETARALCANPDSLQYAPEEIRDDAEALAEFAERYAPPGEEQIVHDGCLVGLKSIGID